MLMNANVESFGLTKLYFNGEVVCCIFQLRHKDYQMEIQVFQIETECSDQTAGILFLILFILSLINYIDDTLYHHGGDHHSMVVSVVWCVVVWCVV